MIYAKIESGSIVKYPYLRQHLKDDNPLVSFPKNVLENETIRSDYNVVGVVSVSPPIKLGWDTVEEDPSFDGTIWSQNWKHVIKNVGDLRSDEILPTDPPVQDGYTADDGVPELIGDAWHQTWVMTENPYLINRMEAYGRPEEQIEFITENGLEAWQARVADIKARYPKS